MSRSEAAVWASGVISAVALCAWMETHDQPGMETAEQAHVRHEAKASQNRADALQIRSNFATSSPSNHQARVRMLEKILDLEPTDDPDIHARLKLEKDALERDQTQARAQASMLHRLSDTRFCARLKRERGDTAMRAEFENRGGSAKGLEYVLDGKIAVGMTEFEVICAWGLPAHSHETIMRNLIDKQFVYSDSTYVYLHNGVMTAITR